MRGQVVLGAAVGLLIGFVAGGVGPRRELVSLRKEHLGLQDKLASQAAPEFLDTWLPRLAAGAGAGAAGVSPPHANGPDDPGKKPDDAVGQEGLIEGGSLSLSNTPSEEEFARLRDMEAIQLARATASLQVLHEQAGINTFQEEQLINALTRAQDRLLEAASHGLGGLLRESSPPARDVLELAREVSGALLDAQEVLDAVIEESGVSPADIDPKARQIWNFVQIDGMADRLRGALTAGGPDGAPKAGVPAGE